MAAIVALLATVGGGNAVPTIPATDFVGTAIELQTEHDPDLAPAPYHFVGVTEMVAQIDATPTAEEVAIVPMVTAAETQSPLTAGCPAVIVETFGEHAPADCAVAWCESHWRSDAVGDGGASLGMFQIQPRWHQWRVPDEDLLDPSVNTRAAWLISSGGTDWSAWTCQP